MSGGLLSQSDGKLNEFDLHGGRYGIEDPRMAEIESRRRGMVLQSSARPIRLSS